MKTYRSFREFLDNTLDRHGYEMKRLGYWYKTIGQALIVVTAQQKRFEPGVYVEYGLAYSVQHPPRNPKPSQCFIFGDNPGLDEAKFARLRGLLKDVKSVCSDPSVQKELSMYIQEQLRCLESWTDPKVLLRRIRSRKLLRMLYNGVDLEKSPFLTTE